MSSVGYGDLVLTNPSSRAFGTVFAIASIFGTVATAGSCVDVYVQHRTAQRIRGFSHEAVRAAFAQIDTDNSGSIDRAEFLAFILIQSGEVEEEKVRMVNEVFDSLDRDSSGEVDLVDIEMSCSHNHPTCSHNVTGAPQIVKAAQAVWQTQTATVRLEL